MKVISRQKIYDYIKKHADAKDSLLSWDQEVFHVHWKTPQDIKNRYRSASFLSDNTVIFNIKGNKYRLIAKIAYNMQTVLIKWIGTHAEYDKQKF
jgi:mRNA interferase HigB